MKHGQLLSIDITKVVFQLCGMDLNNHVMFKKQIKRAKLIEIVLQIKPDTTIVVLCYSANHWRRRLNHWVSKSISFHANTSNSW